jgi:hypothetical protein
MKILFDQGTPVPLRLSLSSHAVSTAHEMGWSELDNGNLLAAAEEAFDVLVTTDRNLRHQQNLARRELAILVLPTTSWPGASPGSRRSRRSAAKGPAHRARLVVLNVAFGASQRCTPGASWPVRSTHWR